MKKIIYLFVILIFCIGCSETEIADNTKGIEIIPDHDEGYFNRAEVNKVPAFKDSSVEKNFEKILGDMARSMVGAEKHNKMVFPINYEIYISKHGKVLKLKNITKKTEYDTDKLEGEIYQNLNHIDQKFASIIKSWEFFPAEKNGEDVGFKKELKGSIIMSPDGKTRITIPIHYRFNDVEQKDFYSAVEIMPSPVGGIGAIQKNVVYPEIARRAGIQGRVFIKAYIDEEGNVTAADVIKGIGGGCDEAAIKAVKLTKFNAAVEKGKSVKVQISIPILFKLK